MEADELDLDQCLAVPTYWYWGPRWELDLISEVEESPMRDSVQ